MMEKRPRSVIRVLTSMNLWMYMNIMRGKYISKNVHTEKACLLKIWMTLKWESLMPNSLKIGLNPFQIEVKLLSKNKLLSTRNQCNLSIHMLSQMEIKIKHKSKSKWRPSQILKFLIKLLILEHMNWRFLSSLLQLRYGIREVLSQILTTANQLTLMTFLKANKPEIWKNKWNNETKIRP